MVMRPDQTGFDALIANRPYEWYLHVPNRLVALADMALAQLVEVPGAGAVRCGGTGPGAKPELEAPNKL